MKPSKSFPFMLETQRPGQVGIQRRPFKNAHQITAAIAGLVADHFVGHLLAWKVNPADPEMWIEATDIMASIAGKPVIEQQQLCLQLSDLFKQMAKEKAMLNSEQLEEIQAVYNSFGDIVGIQRFELPSFMIPFGRELHTSEDFPSILATPFPEDLVEDELDVQVEHYLGAPYRPD